MADHRRRVLVVLLLGALLGMVAHYSSAADRHVTTRRSAAMLESPDAHVGETVYFWAKVEAVEGDTIRVSRSPPLTVRNVDARARPGDAVQVYGTIRPGRTVAAERIVVSPRDRLRELYAVSALGLALAVGGFLRSWTVDPDALALVPREGDDDA